LVGQLHPHADPHAHAAAYNIAILPNIAIFQYCNTNIAIAIALAS
jgi:hypothetical protein